MSISLNIILECLKDFYCDNHMGAELNCRFSQIKLFLDTQGETQDDTLYVAPLSVAIAYTEENNGGRFLCLRDRFRLDDETEQMLSGKIIVTENMTTEKLYSIVKDKFDEISMWNTAMWVAAAKGESLTTVLNLSRDIIKNSINVSDSSMRLIASNDMPTDDQITLRLRKNGYHPEETINAFKKAGCYEEWSTKKDVYTSIIPELSPYLMVNRIFKFRDSHFMQIVMVCDHTPFTPGLLDLFMMLLNVLDVYISKERNDIIKIGTSREQLISDLIENDPEKRDSLKNRLASANIPYTGFFRLFVVALESRNRTLLGNIKSELTALIPTILSVIYQNRLVILVQDDKMPQELYKHVDDIMTKSSAQCGVSIPFESLDDFSDAYNDAQMAVNYSTVYSEGKALPDLRDDVYNAKIWKYEDLGIYYSVSKRLKSYDRWRSSTYWKIISQMYENDLNHNTNNVHVLYLYLRHERRVSAVAQLMFMHRNNVAYRINRICEQYDLDLDKADVRLNLLLAILMLKTVQQNELT